jgi:cytochrome c556
MNMFFRKMILSTLVAVLALAALPVTSVFAQGENPPVREPSAEQLEKAWAHQLKVHERLGKVFEGDAHFDRAQELIDRATDKGLDTSAVQAALNAFSAAVGSSGPLYNEIDALITTHAGFDANGKVMDAAQAQATVQSVRAKLDELRTSMDGTGKALREAIRAFREANKPVNKPVNKPAE